MTKPEEQPHVVVHDRRRIDPETGQVRQTDENAQAEASQGDAPVAPDADAAGVPEVGAEGGGKHAAPEPADEAPA